MIHKQNGLLEFGTFRVDPSQRLLFSAEQQVPLTPKAFDTLLVLIEAQGRIVEKDDLLKKIWPDTFVEEGSLARNISTLRKALGESPDDQKYIQTIPRRGYRFIAPIKSTPEDSDLSPTASAAPPEALVERSPAKPAKNYYPRLWFGLTLLAAIGGIAAWQWHDRTRSRPTVSDRIEALAVLPLQNLSGNSTQDYIADGVTDALITSLAQIRSLRVISRTSVLRYRGTTKSLREIADELGVDTILEGSVQPSGNQLRITTQLIRANSDTHLWANSYQRDLGDILRLEGEVASEVAREVKAEIGAAGEHFQRIGRILPAAQDEYFLALHFQDDRDDSHLVEAIRHYESAIVLQPDFALAYAGLSRVWVQRGVLGDIGFRSAEAPARKAVLRALELDPKLGEAHESLAHILMFYDLAWATAEEEFRRAIEIAPSDVFAHVYYATLLEILGRFDEGVEEGKRSVTLDPVSTTVNSEYGRVLYRARRYDDAIRQLRRTLELEPSSQGTRARLAEALIPIGKYREALALDTPPKFPPNPNAVLLAKLARDHALIGETAEARKLVKQAELSSQEKGYMPIALAHLALGDRDQSMIWLAKAFDERQYVSLIACDPQWDVVRDDPRFRALLKRLGLPDSASK